MPKANLGAVMVCLLSWSCGGQETNPVDQTSNGAAGLSGSSGSPAGEGGAAQAGISSGGQAGASEAGAAGQSGASGGTGASGAGTSGADHGGSAGSGGQAGAVGGGAAGGGGQGGTSGGTSGSSGTGAAGASGGGQGGESAGQAGSGGQAGGGPADPITQLALAEIVSCARHASSKVSCWGRLPSSDPDKSYPPTYLPGLDGTSRLVSTGGAIFAIGSDDLVRFGSFEGPPEVIPTAGPVSLFAASSKATCVRRPDGSLDGWDQFPSSDQPPSPITNLPLVDSLHSSDSFLCALAQGQVFCWGINTHGECGIGSTSLVEQPGPPVVGLHDVVEVSVGYSWACARRPQQPLACWGDNSLESLVPGGPYAVTTPVAIAGTEDAVQVAVGASFACVLRSDKRVACFGYNSQGNLGDPSLAQGEVRTTPTVVAGLEDVVELTASYGHSCARRQDGRVLCWGVNQSRQLGSDPSGAQPDGKLIYNPVPTEVVW